MFNWGRGKGAAVILGFMLCASPVLAEDGEQASDIAGSIASGIQLWQDGADETFNNFVRNEVLPFMDESRVRETIRFKLNSLFTEDELEVLSRLHAEPGGDRIFNKIGQFNSEMGPIAERLFVEAIKCVPPSRRPWQLRDAGEHDEAVYAERCQK